MIRIVSTAFVSLALVASATAAPPSLSELAPDSTFLIFGAPKAAAAIKQLERTKAWELWSVADPKARDEFLREMHEEFEIEPGELSWPTGELGLAVFTVFDGETGQVRPAFLLVADYGDKADELAPIIERLVKRGVDEEKFRVDERELVGRTVRAFEFTADSDGDHAEDEFEMDEMEGMWPESPFDDAFDQAFYAQEGSTFLLTSDVTTLRDVFEVFDGDAPKRLAARDDFQAVETRLGTNDAYAVLINRNLGGLLSAVDPMGMSMMVTPIVKQVIGDVAAMGFGVRIDTPKAMFEQTAAIHMPNGKVGLTALLKTSSPREKLPAFVGQNVLGMTSSNIDFSGLPAAVQPVVQMVQMFMMQGEGANPMAMQQMMEQICSYLGDRMFMVQWAERPLAADSMKQLVAIECTNPTAFEQFLAATAPQMGFEGRDFLGHRLYAMPGGGMGLPAGMGGAPMLDAEPPALGLAGGFAFMGPGSAVEHALRLTDQPHPATLNDNQEFTRALDLLGDAPVCAWGYGDMPAALKTQSEVTQLQVKAMMEEMAAEDPDLAEDIGFDMLGMPDLDLFDWISGTDLERYLGPSVWSVFPDDDGFSVVSYLLAPIQTD